MNQSNKPNLAVALIILMRPHQWIKNFFVFAPLIFTGKFLEYYAVVDVVITFLLFSMAASGVYIVNDLKDVEADRAHPTKRKTRPLAAGWVETREAILLLILLYSFLVVGCVFYPQLIAVLLLYLLINLFYTYVLKFLPVIDIFCIASGFVLRVYAGAAVLDVPVSGWMFITTLCLALFLASIKRKQELAYTKTASRKVLEYYTADLIDKYAEMSGTAALLFYSLFVLTVNQQMVYSVPFVIYGIFRYWYVVDIDGLGESPTKVLLQDPQLISTVVLWISVIIWALWP